MTDTIEKRFQIVLENIDKACAASGRQTNEVTLVVVTKGQPVSKIMEVVNAGATILGENYPEETQRKINEIAGNINPIWHMIGHLQSRKIKLMHPHFQLIHSLDSLDLAEKLNRFYKSISTMCNVLVEVNLAGEMSKQGFDCQSKQKQEEFFAVIDNLMGYKHLNLLGLMTMPPYAVDSKQNDAYFHTCSDLRWKIKDRIGSSVFNHTSMGTSADYENAIECGGTIIRVGEAIMGKRSYQ